jgi:CYTH domain-containing protein
VFNASAPPGKELKYARRERERRFLLRSGPDRPAERTVRIVDRYLASTRLRLRRAIETAGSGAGTERTVYKLTQKVPGPDGEPALITTMYLTRGEYRALSKVPAATLHKTRHSIPPLGVDVFEGPLRGLVLAEAEFDDDASMRDFAAPAGAVAEVTRDGRLSGGRLAVMKAAELVAVLREYDVLDESQEA